MIILVSHLLLLDLIYQKLKIFTALLVTEWENLKQSVSKILVFEPAFHAHLHKLQLRLDKALTICELILFPKKFKGHNRPECYLIKILPHCNNEKAFYFGFKGNIY